MFSLWSPRAGSSLDVPEALNGVSPQAQVDESDVLRLAKLNHPDQLHTGHSRGLSCVADLGYAQYGSRNRLVHSLAVLREVDADFLFLVGDAEPDGVLERQQDDGGDHEGPGKGGGDADDLIEDLL